MCVSQPPIFFKKINCCVGLNLESHFLRNLSIFQAFLFSFKLQKGKLSACLCAISAFLIETSTTAAHRNGISTTRCSRNSKKCHFLSLKHRCSFVARVPHYTTMIFARFITAVIVPHSSCIIRSVVWTSDGEEQVLCQNAVWTFFNLLYIMFVL